MKDLISTLLFVARLSTERSSHCYIINSSLLSILSYKRNVSPSFSADIFIQYFSLSFTVWPPYVTSGIEFIYISPVWNSKMYNRRCNLMIDYCVCSPVALVWYWSVRYCILPVLLIELYIGLVVFRNRKLCFQNIFFKNAATTIATTTIKLAWYPEIYIFEISSVFLLYNIK